MGNEADLHAVHFKDQTVQQGPYRKQTFEMMAGMLHVTRPFPGLLF
jgi:hypothetical protein